MRKLRRRWRTRSSAGRPVTSSICAGQIRSLSSSMRLHPVPRAARRPRKNLQRSKSGLTRRRWRMKRSSLRCKSHRRRPANLSHHSTSRSRSRIRMPYRHRPQPSRSKVRLHRGPPLERSNRQLTLDCDQDRPALRSRCGYGTRRRHHRRRNVRRNPQKARHPPQRRAATGNSEAAARRTAWPPRR